MQWKTTVGLLILTVGVGAYVALVELKQPTVEEQEVLARQVVRVAPEDVTGLLVEWPNTTATLERTHGSWRLVSPLAVRAEEPLVLRVLNELDPLEAERVLEGSQEKPLKASDYGLEPPVGALTILAGSRATKLAFGEPTAVSDHRYAKLPDSPKVFVVNARLFDALDQPLEAFRSHELLNVDTWEATRITVSSARSSYSLAKQSDRWQLTEPLVDEADSAASSTMLSKLKNLRIERFVSDLPATMTEGQAGEPQVEQLPQWGFETPYARITIALGEGTSPLELFIGKPTVDDAEHLYAKRTDEPAIYTVSKPRIDELLQDPQTLRSRACFEFFATQVTKLNVNWQDASWAVEKVNGQWKQEHTHAQLDAVKVEEFLWKLRDVKLTRFVEDHPQDVGRFGLDPPKGRIEVWVREGQEPNRLLVGDPVDGGPTRYGWITGRTSVVELPETITEILGTSPESFQPTQPEASSATP